MPTRNTSDEKADYEREIQKTEQALDILNHAAPERDIFVGFAGRKATD